MLRITSRIALLILGCLVLNAPALAEPEKVGVAAEVNPDVTGQPPNEPLGELLIGHNIIRNEKIATQDAGQAQLLFADQSTLTVAKNSEVVIDEFVYDPQKQVGNLTASLTTGLFRYVGGKISKEKDITFYTPTGTVSVRGGIALIKVHGSMLQAVFVFGERMTVTINSQTQTATVPNTVIYTIGGRPSSPAPASVDMLESLNREMQSSNNQTMTLGAQFADAVPDLPPNFLPTQTQRPNPTFPTPLPPAAPIVIPTPTFAPTAALAATPSTATTPTQSATPTPGPTSTPTPTPTPTSTPTPTPTPTPPTPISTPTPTPTPPPPDHHRVYHDHDHDHDHDHHFGDRFDRFRHWIIDRDFHRPDWEHRDRWDERSDLRDHWSGEDRDHAGDKKLEGHSSFDRYVISDYHGRDDHSGEHHGFDRHPVAGGHAFWNEHGDPSHRFGHPDGHQWTRELLAFDRFRDAISRTGGRHIPLWANGGRRDGHSHARHHISAHR